jgi:hypothetical protein
MHRQQLVMPSTCTVDVAQTWLTRPSQSAHPPLLSSIAHAHVRVVVQVLVQPLTSLG